MLVALRVCVEVTALRTTGLLCTVSSGLKRGTALEDAFSKADVQGMAIASIGDHELATSLWILLPSIAVNTCLHSLSAGQRYVSNTTVST